MSISPPQVDGRGQASIAPGLARVFYPAAAICLILCGWQGLALSELVPEEYLPGPMTTLAAFVDMVRAGDLQSAEWLTLSRALTGAALSSTLGLLLALLGANFLLVRLALQPLVAIFQVLPPAALVPMAIYFLGFGEGFFIFVICFAAIWPTYIVATRALVDTDPQLLATARLFGYSKRDAVLLIRLPAALPEIFTGVRLTAGLALIATVAAEMLASRNGLGFLLFDTAFSLHVDQTFAVLLAVALNGLIVNGIAVGLRRLTCGWRDGLEATAHA